MRTLRVDSGILSAWLGEDADFAAYPCRVYLDRETGQIVGVYEQDRDATLAGDAEEDNRQRRQEVATQPGAFLEIPIPDHGQRHKWFREFLESWGQEDTYFGSIGGWLKQYGTTDDRYAWRNFEWDCVIQHAVKVAEVAGLKLEVT